MSVGKRNFIKIPLGVIFVLGPVVAWLGFGQHGFIHLYRVGKERQAYVQRIEKLTQENQALYDEIQRLRTDPRYVEQVARKELGLIKENEVIYRFSKKRARKIGVGQSMKGNTSQDDTTLHKRRAKDYGNSK